jgi:hypothetical protein
MRYRCGWLFLRAPQIQAGIGAAPDRYGRPLRAPYRCGRPASVSFRRSDSSLANELSAAGNFQRPRASSQSSQASKAISGRCRHWPVDWGTRVQPAVPHRSSTFLRSTSRRAAAPAAAAAAAAAAGPGRGVEAATLGSLG